jgi:hypothetical protein
MPNVYTVQDSFLKHMTPKMSKMVIHYLFRLSEKGLLKFHVIVITDTFSLRSLNVSERHLVS